MLVVQRETQGLGVDLRHGAEVWDWRGTARRIDAVQTRSGDIEGEEFVLCGGIWSTELARKLGLSLGVTVFRGGFERGEAIIHLERCDGRGRHR